MNDKALLRAWKWIYEGPYILLFFIVACSSIVACSNVPTSFGAWITCTSFFCVLIIWYILRQKFYKKHERLIVTRELEELKKSIEKDEHFLATGKWPDPEQVKPEGEVDAKTDDH